MLWGLWKTGWIWGDAMPYPALSFQTTSEKLGVSVLSYMCIDRVIRIEVKQN